MVAQQAILANGFVSKMEFNLNSMDSGTSEKPSHQVDYYLVLDKNRQLLLNDLLGKQITLKFSGEIKCQNCHKSIKKSYQQGYCYVCATRLARCDLCIVNPHTCHYHLGTCREPSWGEKNCFIPYIIYLANSSGVKVGVSRESNLLNRWVDQGAIQGLAIIKTTSRYQAGLIEFALAKFIQDKTNWRKMLSFNVALIDLCAVREQLLGDCNTEIQTIIKKLPPNNIEIISNLSKKDIVTINYPYINSDSYDINPGEKQPIRSLSKLIKPQLESSIQDQLIAIKGQYLLFKNGVLNLRNFSW
jgi:hypothetical protein